MSEKKFDAKKFLQYKFKATEALKGVLKTKPRQNKASRKSPTHNFLLILIIAILIASVIRLFFVQVFTVPSNAMEPTFRPGDRIMINKLTYGIANPLWGFSNKKKFFFIINNPFYGRLRAISGDRYIVRLSRDPKRFDVIAIRSPVKPNEETRDMIKRIIGLPNETLKIKKGKVYINGRELKEKYPIIADKSDLNSIRIPYGSYFVLGDNRAGSSDSRSWGPLSGNEIIGIYYKTIWHNKADIK